MLRQLLARTTDSVIQENQYILENGFNTQAGEISGVNGTSNITNNSGYIIPVPSSAFITNNDCFPLKDKHTISSNESIINNINILPNHSQSFIDTTTGNQNFNYYNSTYNNFTTNQDSIALNTSQISNNENGFYFDGNGGEFCQNYLFRNESNNNNNLNNTNSTNLGISEGDWNQQYNLSFVPINKNQSLYNGDNNFNEINQNYYHRNISIENNNTLEINGHSKSIDDNNYRNSVTSISSINSVGSICSKQNNKPSRKPSRSIRSSQAAFSEAFKKMALLRHISNKCDNDSNYYSIDDAEIGPVRCVACLGEYPSKRSLTGHIGRNEKCREIIGRNYLDQLSQNGNKNILITDYSNDGISPVCPYCDRFISHYKGNIRRHINQCLKNDKKKRCRKSKENKEEYDNNTIMINNNYDDLSTTKSIECHNISNNNKQTPSFDDPFMCNLCSFLTVYKGNMKRHLMACHNYNDVIFRTGTIDLEQLHASRQGKTISPTLLMRLTKKGKKCNQIIDNNNKLLPQNTGIVNNTDYQTKNNIKKKFEENKFVQSNFNNNINGITRKLSPGAEARIDTSVQTVIENGLSYYSTI
ncbi:Hypothetical protein SRAE_1000010000 [Strongyloides ratti]|uniref:Uncharacterized protein n=1 Tax=Strongyloides ratti TaxID=34506 RepID=A0A090L2X9_STRRB|nr:Hypothetical protein SRAE_1000010000 [Strongyloides ratti]CEF61824.1 Hypothetical protein SRAE_1000010000 [Strongyloides ratti]